MKNELTAKRLKLALANKHMKPQELADASGVSKSSISQYLNGSHKPSNISSGSMAEILGVNPLWLMGFDTPMEDVLVVSDLTPAEAHLIDIYRDLNDDGQEKVTDYAEDIAENPRYIKRRDSGAVLLDQEA